jgi:hypothetical protein
MKNMVVFIDISIRRIYEITLLKMTFLGTSTQSQALVDDPLALPWDEFHSVLTFNFSSNAKARFS